MWPWIDPPVELADRSFNTPDRRSEGWTRLVRDESGVSPVIGVVLMVAITVTLAAVIGGVVVGYGSQLGQTTPHAVVTVADVDEQNDEIVVRHEGGDTLSTDELDLVVEVSGESLRFDATGHRTSEIWRPADRSTIAVGTGEWSIDDEVIHNTSETLNLGNDDSVDVRFVHEPSGEILFEETVYT